MNYHLIIIGIFSFIFFSGCGQILPKLTDNQKLSLKQVIAEAGNAFQAPTEARVNGSITHLSYYYTSGANNHRFNMADILHHSLSKGECQDLTDSKQLNSPHPFNFPSIYLAGQKCPILFNIKTTAKEKMINLDLKYQVQSEDYKKLNDIDQANMNFSGNQVGSSTLFVSLNGKFHSQSMGDIVITGSLKKDETQFIQSLIRFDFSGFAAELKSQGNQKSMKYYLNSEEIPSSEIREYFNSEVFPSHLHKLSNSSSRIYPE